MFWFVASLNIFMNCAVFLPSVSAHFPKGGKSRADREAQRTLQVKQSFFTVQSKQMYNIAGYLYPIHVLFVLLLCSWIINPLIITITIPQI